MPRILYFIVLFPFLANAQTPTATENYVRTKNYKQPTTTAIPTPTPAQATQSVTYYDGLGRPIQQLANAQSNSGKDIVTPIEYDTFGRQVKEYLPFASTQNTLTIIDPTTLKQNLLLQYQTQYGDSIPFSKKRYESSPLNRVLEQAAPGNDWGMNSGVKHTVRFDYQTNTATEVKLFAATATWNSTTGLYAIALSQTGTTNYGVNQLYKTITKDENWISGTNNTTEEFKDKEGRVILKRTYDNNVAHDTYYVYDQFGNLTYVIPPKADASITSTVLDELCYQYKYDYRNRLVEKKLPGKQWEFIVYDKLDRVVATGPALSPFSDLTSSGWMITKYDVFNRAVLTGWMPSTTVTSAGRKTMQDSQNTATVLSETKSASNTTINTVAYRYTNNVIPTTGYHVMTVNYYDDYTTNLTFTPAIAYTTSVTPQPVFYNNTAGTLPKGLPTVSWIRVPELSTTNPAKAEMSYTLYDNKARAVRSFTNNYLGGYTQVDSQLETITGRTNYTLTTHKRLAASTVITVREDFTYTAQDRLLTHTHKINNDPTQLIVKNNYDELGQLLSKQVGGTDVTTYVGLQKVDYRYNIRGWLTGINDTANLTQGSDPQDLFAFSINYNATIANNVGNTIVPLYNGNIAEISWRTKNDNIQRRYGYSYDNLNRLKNAVYQKPNNAVPVTNSYNESMIYDKNGNIMKMLRNGEYDDAVYSLQIDNLTYTYDTTKQNQLVKVDDATNNLNGFKDVNNAVDYTYDLNGNMVTDQNKGITGIVYNHLNLPIKITFGTTGTIEYLYNATGEKLKKTVTQGASVLKTDYIDGFQYTQTGNGTVVLDFFPHAEGYVKNTVVTNLNTYNYVFNYTDHLGNTRLNYGLQNNVLTILEENNYYPYGLQHKNYNVTKKQYGTNGSGIIVETCVNCSYKYKFNGYELQDELGLNMYDYGFRNYMPDIGRFTTIDPMTDFVNYQTPYAISDNNPVMYLDEDGLGIFRVLGNLFGRIGNAVASIFAGDSCTCKNHDSESFADSWNTMDFPVINDWINNLFSGNGKSNTKSTSSEPSGEGSNGSDSSRLDVNPISLSPSSFVMNDVKIGTTNIGIPSPRATTPLAPKPIPLIGSSSIYRTTRDVQFSQNSNDLNSAFTQKTLKDLIKTLVDYPQLHVLISANVTIDERYAPGSVTPDDGTWVNGKQTTIRGLMQQRAKAIKRFLIKRGVDASQISTGSGTIKRGGSINATFTITN